MIGLREHRPSGTPTAPPRLQRARLPAAAPRAALPDTAIPSFGALPLRAGERGRGRSDGDLPRLPGPKLDAEAEPEFDKNPDCLGQFSAFTSEPVFGRVDERLCAFQAPFTVWAQFKPPCKCSQLEYRQFIRGHITRDPDGAAENRGDLLSKLPLGRLWESYQEDGDTSASPPKYGYRSSPAVERENLTDRYLNAKNEPDQANGCKYEGADTPYATFFSRPGEIWDIQLDFHGDILRDGRVIARRFWTPIKGRFTAP